jgi:hypothetical protein
MVAVSPLPVPPTDAIVDALTQNESVRLFCERALEGSAAFVLTDRNAPAVAQLCRHLDGLPLAIELAAARARSLSPDDLVARIGERFRLLTKGSRSTHQRHHTLRATIDWSYNLLTPAEQCVLNRMFVFAGGCDLAAAEAVLGVDGVASLEVADLLGELVDKSLVEVDVTDGTKRYRQLETIRQYTRERLDAAAEGRTMRTRHLTYYIALAEEAGPHLRHSEAPEWMPVVAREIDNFRAAMDWAVEAGLAEAGLRLVLPLTVPASATGWSQTDWIESVLSIPGASHHPLFPLAAAIAAEGAAMHVELDRAASLLATAQDAQIRLGTQYPDVFCAAAILELLHGDLNQARRDARENLELTRATQDPFLIAGALLLYGTALQPEKDEAAAALEEAVSVARDADIPFLFQHAICSLIDTVVHEQPSRAQALLQEATDAARRLGDPLAIARVACEEAGISLVLGDWRTALLASTDAAEQEFQIGALQLGVTLRKACMALAHLEFFEPAAVLAGFVDAHVPVSGVSEWQALFARTDQLLLDALGSTRRTELRAHGATLGIDDAVEYLRTVSEGVLAYRADHAIGAIDSLRSTVGRS